MLTSQYHSILGASQRIFLELIASPGSVSSALLRKPMITQCVTAGVLFGAGDIIAQQAVEGKGKDHDVNISAVLNDGERAGALTFGYRMG